MEPTNVCNMDFGRVFVGEREKCYGGATCYSTAIRRVWGRDESCRTSPKMDIAEFPPESVDIGDCSLISLVQCIKEVSSRAFDIKVDRDCGGGGTSTVAICAYQRGGPDYIAIECFGEEPEEVLRLALYELSLRTIRYRVVAQMDATPTDVGVADQVADQAGNTMITTDAIVASDSVTDESISVMSEPDFSFESVMNRWIPIKDLAISSTWTGDSIELPRDIFKIMPNSPNLNPFRTFVYSLPHMEIMIKCNGYKMCVGKIVASIAHDPYLVDDTFLKETCIQREHALLDVSTNNEILLNVPLRYHRTALRNILTRAHQGTEVGYSSRLDILPLSPMKAGLGSPAIIYGRVFVKFAGTTFNGMTYAVPMAQMHSIKKLIGAVEDIMDVLPIPLDKPADPIRTFVIPSGRAQFATGKGTSGAQPLRMDPTSLTAYGAVQPYPGDPMSFEALARIWGLRSTFPWSVNDKVNASLGTILIDPTVRAYSQDVKAVLTPFEYAAACFNFWSGTIEFEFQFVSNAFHTGTIMLSAEYGREVQASNLEEVSSTYTKVFHLGEQKVVNFTVPYIYDTPMRRSTTTFLTLYKDQAAEDYKKDAAIALGHKSFTRLRISVVNALVPIAAIPQIVEVLVFMRAGPDMKFHSLKSREWTFPIKAEMDQDPTGSFSGTTRGYAVNVRDNQMSFMDIVKRPVLMFENITIPQTCINDTKSFYIPIRPLSRGLAGLVTPGFCTMSLNSPTAAIMDLFRFWRGSMRYHVFCRSATAGVLYATLIPHTGVLRYGEFKINTIDWDGYAPHNLGLFTEVAVLSVNSSMEVECPYDTEIPWTLTWASNDPSGMRSREVGDYASGHIAFATTVADLKVDIWVSCGDDFTMANFYGVPELTYNKWNYMWYDTESNASLQIVERKAKKVAQGPPPPALLVKTIPLSADDEAKMQAHRDQIAKTQALEAQRVIDEARKAQDIADVTARAALDAQKAADAKKAVDEAKAASDRAAKSRSLFHLRPDLHEVRKRLSHMAHASQDYNHEDRSHYEAARRRGPVEYAGPIDYEHINDMSRWNATVGARLKAARRMRNVETQSIAREGEIELLYLDCFQPTVTKINEFIGEYNRKFLVAAQEALSMSASDVKTSVANATRVNEYHERVVGPYADTPPQEGTIDAYWVRVPISSGTMIDINQWNNLTLPAKADFNDRKATSTGYRSIPIPVGMESHIYPYFKEGVYYIQPENISRDFTQVYIHDGAAQTYVWKDLPSKFVLIKNPSVSKWHGDDLPIHAEMAKKKRAKGTLIAKAKDTWVAKPEDSFVESVKANANEYIGPWHKPVDMALAAAACVPGATGAISRAVLAATKGVKMVSSAVTVAGNANEAIKTIGPKMENAIDGALEASANFCALTQKASIAVTNAIPQVDEILSSSTQVVKDAGSSINHLTGRANSLVDCMSPKVDNILNRSEIAIAHIDEVARKADIAISALQPKLEQSLVNADDVATAIKAGVAQITADTSAGLKEFTTAGQAVAEMAGSVNDLISESVKPVVDAIKSFTSGIWGHLTEGVAWTKLLIDLAMDGIMGYMTMDYRVMALGVVRFIMNISGFSANVLDYVDSMTSAIKEWFTPKAEAYETSSASRYVACLATVVISIFGIKDLTFAKIPISKKLFQLGSVAAGATAVFRLITVTFDALIEIVAWIIGWESEEARALKMLNLEKKEIDVFLQNANDVLNDANSRLRRLPSFRRMFWKTCMQASRYRKLIAKIPTSAGMNNLNQLCVKVIEKANDCMTEVCAAPVRYEPFVVCLQGDSGIGKSFLSNDLVTQLASVIDMPDRGGLPIYTRGPQSKYWDGYADQPIIKYDDWMNSNDPEIVAMTVDEMYRLKTSAPFAPTMAAVEEKKITGNPLLVVMVCNNAYPRDIVATMSPYHDAVFRRRDLVVQARLTERAAFLKKKFKEEGGEPSVCEVKRIIDTICAETPDAGAYPHLEFQFYRSGTDDRFCPLILTWEKTIEFFKAKHLEYFTSEYKNYQDRYKTVTNKLLTGSEVDIGMDDPFEAFYGVLNSTITKRSRDTELFTDHLEFVMSEVAKTDSVAMLPPKKEETPVVAESLSLWHLFSGLFVITSDIIDSFSNYALEQLVSLTARMVRSLDKTTKGKCSVCGYDDVEIAGMCKENRHYICAACIKDRTSCVVDCKSKQWIGVVSRADGWLYTVFRIASTGALITAEYVRNMVDKLKEATGISPVGWLMLATAIKQKDAVLGLQAWSMKGKTEPTQLDEKDRSRYEWSITSTGKFKAWPIVAVAQSPGDFPGLPDRGGESPSAVSALTPKLNEKLLAACILPDENVKVCFHKELITQVQVVSWCYESGGTSGFKISVPVHHSHQMILVQPRACSAKDCPFLKLDDVKKFALDHLSAAGTSYVKYYADLYKGVREKAMNEMPRFYWPEWCPLATVAKEEIPDDWWSLLGGPLTKWATFLTVVTGACATLWGVTKLYGLFKWMIAPVAQVAGDDSPTTASVVRSNVSRFSNKSMRFEKRIRAEAAGVLEAVADKIQANYMVIRLYVDDKDYMDIGCVGICGKSAIFPRHYYPSITKCALNNWKIIIFPPGQYSMALRPTCVHYTHDPSDFSFIEDLDLCVMKVPHTIPMFKDIRRYFATVDDLVDKPICSTGTIVTVPGKHAHKSKIVTTTISSFMTHVDYYADGGDTTIRCSDVLAYDQSGSGMCGSLLLISGTERPIAAMHVAGNGYSTGYGVTLPAEIISEHVSEIVAEMQTHPCRPMEEGNTMNWPDDCLHIVGQVDRNLMNYQPDVTKLVPSLVSGELGESGVAPAILTTYDPRYTHEKSPLWHGARKHGKLTTDFTSTQVRAAVDALYEGWIIGMKPLVVAPTRMSPEQAVVGSSVQYYDPIKLSTSAGWPWTKRGPNTSKRAWITPVLDQQERIVGCHINQELLGCIEDKRALRATGIAASTVFADTLKDEKRPIEKLMKPGGTRVICASPVDYTIALRQNYLHFTAAFMAARFKVMSAVGINVHGGEWYSLYSHLTQKSYTNIIELDYSNFGPGFNANVAAGACEIMVRWTMKYVVGVCEAELRSLLMECINSQHIAAQTVYQQVAGSPSGAAITTIINSLVNELYILIAWRAVTGQSYASFRENVALVVYGDDLIMSVTDKFKDVWNTHTITDYFAQFKIAATTATKNATEVQAFKPMHEVIFLKRRFAKHPTRPYSMLAPLDWNVIVGMTEYVTKSQDLRAETEVNLMAALFEVHSHGPDKFYAFKKRIIDVCAHHGLQPPLVSWDEIDNKWADGTLLEPAGWPEW